MNVGPDGHRVGRSSSSSRRTSDSVGVGFSLAAGSESEERKIKGPVEGNYCYYYYYYTDCGRVYKLSGCWPSPNSGPCQSSQYSHHPGTRSRSSRLAESLMFSNSHSEQLHLLAGPLLLLDHHHRQRQRSRQVERGSKPITDLSHHQRQQLLLMEMNTNSKISSSSSSSDGAISFECKTLLLSGNRKRKTTFDGTETNQAKYASPLLVTGNGWGKQQSCQVATGSIKSISLASYLMMITVWSAMLMLSLPGESMANLAASSYITPLGMSGGGTSGAHSGSGSSISSLASLADRDRQQQSLESELASLILQAAGEGGDQLRSLGSSKSQWEVPDREQEQQQRLDQLLEVGANDKALAEAIISKIMLDNMTTISCDEAGSSCTGSGLAESDRFSELNGDNNFQQYLIQQQQNQHQQQQRLQSNQRQLQIQQQLQLKQQAAALGSLRMRMLLDQIQHSELAEPQPVMGELIYQSPILPPAQLATIKRATPRSQSKLNQRILAESGNWQPAHNEAVSPTSLGGAKRPDSSNILRIQSDSSGSYLKRPSNNRQYEFGLGKRVATPSFSRYDFGLGKRDIQSSKDFRYDFGLGK